jgi:hypothetical protein
MTKRKTLGRPPEILRQRIVAPGGREPIGEEINIVKAQILERFVALSKYYDVLIGSPEWNERWPDWQKGYEGFQFMGYPGRKGPPDQPFRDVLLCAFVEVSLIQGVNKTKATKCLADQWGMNAGTLRVRYYNLTNPKERDHHNAVSRMPKAAKELTQYFISKK